MNQVELDRPRMSCVWLSASLFRPAARDDLADWLSAEHGVDVSGPEWGTALEFVEPWPDLEPEAWCRPAASAPAEFAEWCAAYRAATPDGHNLIVTVGNSSRVQGRVTSYGVSVSYPASRLVSAEEPVDAMIELVLTVVDKDIDKRGLGIASLREVTRLR